MISKRFEQFGFPLIIDETIIPDDNTTLFVCSGMQRIRKRFLNPDNSKHGSLQSCIRTNDLELVGDGSHLTYFEMLGNFSFGGDYKESVELWHSILIDLKIKVDPVHYHPDCLKHRDLWTKLGYETVEDLECVWSDGEIGGYCCEIYSNNVEIGNLVNTLGHSTDVGFGWQRILSICGEPIDYSLVGDHKKTLECLWKNKIQPGAKGRNFICRRLLRRLMPHVVDEKFIFDEWIDLEKKQQEKKIREGRKSWRKNRHQPVEWWWSTCGILPEEIHLIKD